MKQWLVSLALPIEADSPQEAVHEFWRYVGELGAEELPAFVWPPGNETDMLAFVADGPAPLDPEDD